ncbi:hypothetical protein [Streptomyces phaeochromogenes]
MTKSGPSGPKARARKAQQSAGVRYTQARRTTSPSRNGRTVQFLLEDRYELGTLAVQLAAAWARQWPREPRSAQVALRGRPFAGCRP